MTGAELDVAGPPTIDPTTAIKDFEDMVATKPDGVTVFPIPAEQWVRPFKQAAEAGVKLNAIRVQPTEGSEVPLYVGMKEKEAAEDLVHVFAEELGPEASGEIVLGIGPVGEPVNENRIFGYEAAIEKEMPNVKIVGPITTGNEPVENLNNWTQIFSRYPDALAYIGTTDQDCGSMAKLKGQGKNRRSSSAPSPSVENQCLPGSKKATCSRRSISSPTSGATSPPGCSPKRPRKGSTCRKARSTPGSSSSTRKTQAKSAKPRLRSTPPAPTTNRKSKKSSPAGSKACR